MNQSNECNDDSNDDKIEVRYINKELKSSLYSMKVSNHELVISFTSSLIH